jgi:hypothetical protein
MRPPSKDEHLRKAEKNKSFAESIKTDNATNIGWAPVAAFYSALHLLTHLRRNTTRTSAVIRNAEVQRNPQLAPLCDEYRDLFTLGWNARYTMQNYSSSDHEQGMASLKVVEDSIMALL